MIYRIQILSKGRMFILLFGPNTRTGPGHGKVKTFRLVPRKNNRKFLWKNKSKMTLLMVLFGIAVVTYEFYY
jgi:hypothetical protein